MSLPTDPTGSASIDPSEWFQFEIPGLEDYDFSNLEMPSLPELPLETIPALDDLSAVQSPHLRNPQRSTLPRSRRASVVTVRRRSSPRSDQDIVSVTLEDATGKKRSWDVNIDTAYDTWFNMISADQVSNATQHQVPTLLTHESQSNTSLADQRSSLSSYIPTANPNFQSTVTSFPMTEDPLVPTMQMVPMLSSSPADILRRAGRASASVPGSSRQAQRRATVAGRQKAPKRPQPTQERVAQRKSHGGRPPLPDDIVLFVNTHHMPNNDGRVPDKRGNKDTTVANDYYYSISKLDDLALPTSELTVSYNGIEFDAGLSFTGDEFLEYLHCASQRPNRQPILRIQIQPSQYNHRYKRAGQSFKCRFTGCPDKRGTILKGQARVCISEFDDEHGDWLNPFHNAGYVHLFCLEQQTNLIELCDDHPGIPIKPETRSLAHEPPATTNMRLNNPMMLNDVEQAVVAEWLTEIGSRWNNFKFIHRDPALRPKFELGQEDTLTYRLTKAHMDNRVLRSIQKKRKLDAGDRVTAHLDQFVGDVSKQVALQKKMKKQPPPKKKPNTGKIARAIPSPEPAAKRRRVTSPLPPSPQHQAMLNGEELETQLSFPKFLNGGDDFVDLSYPASDGPLPLQSPSHQQAVYNKANDAAYIPIISPPPRRTSPRSRRLPPTLLAQSPPGVAKRRSSA